MGLLSWIVTGAAAGAVARYFLPGRPGGFVAVLVLAVIGALIGGYISSYFNWGTLAVIHPRALGLALVGALLMILVARKLRL